MLRAYQYNSFYLLNGSHCGWELTMTQILVDECRTFMQGSATFRILFLDCAVWGAVEGSVTNNRPLLPTLQLAQTALKS